MSDRAMQLALGSAIVILLAVGAFSYRGLTISDRSDHWVRHSHEVLANLQQMLLAMTTIEASSRGFVLTGEESYLDTYHASIADLLRHEATVRDLTMDNPVQQRQLPVLEQLAAQRIQFAEEVVGLRRDRGLEAASDAIRSGRGEQMMRGFAAVVRQSQDEELRLLVRRDADAKSSLGDTKAVLILGSVLGLLTAAVAGWTVWRASSGRGVAEKALQHSEQKYRTLIQGIRDHAILMLGPRGEIVSWNPGAERMTGCAFEDIVGHEFSSLFPPEDIERGRLDEILRLAAENGLHEEQGTLVHKDGSRFMVRSTFTALRDESGNLRGFSVTSLDLSESVESGTKYRGLLEAAPDAMVVVNPDGEIVLLNLQAEKQFGYRRDELLGQQVKNIIPQGFAERLIADGLRSADDALAQQIGAGIELTARRKDGSEFPIELMLSPLESVDGVLVTAAIRDITTRKAAEAHLLQKVEELNRSNEELGQFAHIASHDLQEPLRMVASYTALLSKRYKGKLDADADQFIGFAVDGASRMHRLIQDLLAYSRVGSKGKELLATSSEDALEQALLNLRGAIEESGALVTHSRLPSVLADEMQLIQLFQNLVGNAIKYQRPGVPQVHIAATGNGSRKWTFEVQDNGLGIEPQYFERIFGMFQRLHRREEFAGTGVGLAICKKIVERHGGSISVESQPGTGSTFRFDLAASA